MIRLVLRGALASLGAVLLTTALPAAASSVTHVVTAGLVSEGSHWLPPLGRPLRLAAPFRAPEHRYAAGHRGIDMPRSVSEVRAPAGGTVSFVGTVVDRGVISLRVDERTVVSLEPIDAEGSSISAGDAVQPGQLLGTVADGGHCGMECVHLGVRVNGDYVNPMRYFLGRPILLPW